MNWIAAIASKEIALMVLTAAVLAALFRRWNQPTIVAYLTTGLLLGPVALNLVQGNEMTRLMSELGLSFLLFFIGLEIELEEIKEILRPTLKVGLSHMAFIAAVGYFIGFLLEFNVMESLFVAAAVMFSSTAVVVKLLADKDQLSTLPGKLDVGVLLLQDLVVVLILTFIKLDVADPATLLTGIGKLAFMIVFIGPVAMYASRRVLKDWFEGIADKPNIFFIHGLTWLFIFLNISQALNVSAEIGAFLAGLTIAQIPYSHELQERVRPLTDFFMALFFVNIGLQLTASGLALYLNEALIAALILIPAKFAGMFVLADRSNFTPETSFKAGINMVQVSEFALVLGAVGVAEGLISVDILGFLSLVTVLTIAGSTYLIEYSRFIYDRIEFILQHAGSEGGLDYEVKKIEDHAVVVGYDQMAKNAAEVLKDHYSDILIVDKDPRNVKELSESDYEYIYGDFKHADTRQATRLGRAAFVISFSPEKEVNKKALEDSHDATVFVKATRRTNAAELYDMGAHYVILKNVLTANKINEYLEAYFKDPELFESKASDYLNKLHWGGRNL